MKIRRGPTTLSFKHNSGCAAMDATATLPPVNLTAAQAVAVAVALAAQRGAPYGVDGRAALEKLLDVMDPAARDLAQQLAGRVWVRQPPAAPHAVTAAVEEALARRRVLALTYRDRLGRPSQRRVTPDRAHQRPVVTDRPVPHPPGPTLVPLGLHRPRLPHHRARARP